MLKRARLQQEPLYQHAFITCADGYPPERATWNSAIDEVAGESLEPLVPARLRRQLAYLQASSSWCRQRIRIIHFGGEPATCWVQGVLLHFAEHACAYSVGRRLDSICVSIERAKKAGK